MPYHRVEPLGGAGIKGWPLGPGSLKGAGQKGTEQQMELQDPGFARCPFTGGEPPCF
jgi:hypothetical protein